jgi:hypothetical protein
VTITICSIFIHVPVPAQNSDQLSAQTISSLQEYGEGENMGKAKITGLEKIKPQMNKTVNFACVILQTRFEIENIFSFSELWQS